MKKKILSVILAAVVALTLVACSNGQSKTAEATDVSSLKTLGDAFAVESEFWTSAYDDDYYVYVFENGGKPTRVCAALTPETRKAIDEIDFAAEDGFDAINKVVADLEIEKVEDLSVGIPTDEELASMAGMTGAQLIEAGYEENGWSIWDGNTDVFFMKGMYNFKVTFNEKIDVDSIDDEFNAAEAVADFTVKSVEYDGLAYNCTDLSVTP